MGSRGTTLSASLKKIPHLSLIASIAKKRNINIWLVGGFLRDACLKKEDTSALLSISSSSSFGTDFDFCVEKSTFLIVREFAKKISSKFIILDKKQQTLRVILKKKGKLYTYDFTLIRGKNIGQDLALRDFSINTLAVDLGEKKIKLIDYFSAKDDIKRRVIKVIKKEVIPQDPLRILRGFSFAANYGFRIENKTFRLMAKHKRLLKGVSKERINEELFKVFNSSHSYRIIKAMDKIGVIDEIIPYIDKTRGVKQGGYHHLDVWNHSLEALRQFELLWVRKLVKDKDILAYLSENIAGKRQRFQIIKLACLLHDIGKPKALKRLKKKTIFHTHEKIGAQLIDGLAESLRLSLREKDILKKLIFWHLRPGYLAGQIKPTKRAIYHFFRDTREDGVAVILLSLSDWRATRGPLTNLKRRKKHEKIMLSLIDFYFAEKRKKPLPKIVDGYDIMKKFKIVPGTLIGVILRKIEEEQALGRVYTKTQAYGLAKKIIAQKTKNLHFGSVSKTNQKLTLRKCKQNKGDSKT